MIFNDKVNIYKYDEQSDGFGGTVRNKVNEQELNCKIVPYHVEADIIANGRKHTSYMKVFTKEQIPFDLYGDFFMNYKNQEWQKVDICDYDKVVYFLMKLVTD